MEQDQNVLKIELSKGWINGKRFEQCLDSSISSENKLIKKIEIIIPEDCAIMVDTAIRLLSYVNQLNDKNVQVYLNILAGEDRTFGYLNRIGFFDHLHENIEVLPDRPIISRAEIYHGENPGVFLLLK